MIQPFLLLSTRKESIAQLSFGSWSNWLPLFFKNTMLLHQTGHLPELILNNIVRRALWRSTTGNTFPTLCQPFPYLFCVNQNNGLHDHTSATSLFILYIACGTNTVQIYHCLDTKQQSLNELFQKWIQIPSTYRVRKKSNLLIMQYFWAICRMEREGATYIRQSRDRGNIGHKTQNEHNKKTTKNTENWFCHTE
jgi:hypothetical protein